MFNTLFHRAAAAALSLILAAGIPTAGTIFGALDQLPAVTEIIEQVENNVSDIPVTEPASNDNTSAVNDAAEAPSATQTAETTETTAADITAATTAPADITDSDENTLSLYNSVAKEADKNNVSESVSIGVSQYIENIGSDGSTPRVVLSASGLGDGKYKARIYYKGASAGSFNYKEKDLSSDGTAVWTSYPSLSGGRSYEIYTALYLSGSEVAWSETVTISAVKPTINNSDVSATPSIEGQSTGSITIAGGYKYLAYYPYGGSINNAVKVSGSTITGLSAGEYYVFVPAYSVGNTYYLRSSSKRIKVEETQAEHYYVSLASDEQSSWSVGDKTVSVIQGRGQTLDYQVSIDSAYRNTHVIDSVTIQPQNAVLSIDKTSDTQWSVTISEITGDVTVAVTSKPIPEYTVTLAAVEGAKWSQNGGKDNFSIKTSGSKSVYVKPTDTDRYYIYGVKAEPEGKASVTFSESTGEVYVTNVTGDITLTPQVIEKSVPSAVSVTGVHFNENGIYSESDPAIQVTFTVEVKDQFGEIVPGTKVYFKDDVSEVSPVQNRKTDSDGNAEFKYSYDIRRGQTKADYNALFSVVSDFPEGDLTAAREIHLVLQKRADLVLYDDQIVGTSPGENNGKVIKVPDNYEIWTGEVHQGALSGDGQWINPTNGEFTGLSSGQHVIRAGEYVDSDTSTFYFASDYADFFIPRGLWTVTVDTEASENVIFTSDTEQTAEPGGDVYVYVEPEEGYEINEYYVDKPGRIQSLSYSEQAGYILIESITGSIVLTVKADKDEDDQSEQPDNPDNPDNPDDPDDPDDPDNPVDPDNPDNPVDPDNPDNPDKPEQLDDIIYEFIEGSGSTWVKGSSTSLRFRANGELDKFTAAKLDGQIIPNDSYTASRGSTIIAIAPEYLEKLSLGAHTLTLYFSDGHASTGFTVKQSEVKGASDNPSTGRGDVPKTGDYTSGIVIVIMTAALLLSAAVLIILRIDDTWLVSVIRYIK